MEVMSISVLAGAPILLALLAGFIVLQVFLSKRESKWPGLILPIVFFLAAAILTLLSAVNMPAHLKIIGAEYFLRLLPVFLLANIPTVTFLLIYFPNRKKSRRNKQLDKMNILDLD